MFCTDLVVICLGLGHRQGGQKWVNDLFIHMSPISLLCPSRYHGAGSAKWHVPWMRSSEAASHVANPGIAQGKARQGNTNEMTFAAARNRVLQHKHC